MEGHTEQNLRAEIIRLEGNILRLKKEIEDLKNKVNVQATVIRIIRGIVELLSDE